MITERPRYQEIHFIDDFEYSKKIQKPSELEKETMEYFGSGHPELCNTKVTEHKLMEGGPQYYEAEPGEKVFSRDYHDCVGGRVINLDTGKQIVFHLFSGNPRQLDEALKAIDAWIKKEKDPEGKNLRALVFAGTKDFRGSNDLYVRALGAIKDIPRSIFALRHSDGSDRVFFSGDDVANKVYKEIYSSISVLCDGVKCYLNVLGMNGCAPHMQFLYDAKDRDDFEKRVFALKNPIPTLYKDLFDTTIKKISSFESTKKIYEGVRAVASNLITSPSSIKKVFSQVSKLATDKLFINDNLVSNF